MPLKLDIKRKLSARSDRVKCVDLHPSEPWMLASLYNGNVHVWNYESNQLIKSFEVCEQPVRAAKFCPRKNWLITGSDDMQIRVYNYNTRERAHHFEAHSDYIRSLAVHPTQPFLLSSSDDMLIKLWDWEKKWSCAQVFEGHTHYVMQIVINPKDSNTFASASLDRTIKVWQLGSPTPNFTLEGHEKGVNCVDYYHGADKPYLVSGADDRLVKLWDYQNKNCVQTLEGHAQNVSAVSFHPELPIIMTGSEDGTVRIWHANTYRLESTLNYGMERAWTIGSLKGSNMVAIGFDEGSTLINLGREFPAMSMDCNGRIVWAKHNEIQQASLKQIGAADETKDGERLSLQVKDMGSCEVYPQTISHNPNGRFVVICGDGEYIIYTAMALRNKSFGSAQEFVWSLLDSSTYAIRENSTTVKLFRNFKETKSFRPEFGADAIFGGHLLGVRSPGALAFFDWESNELVRRIEISPKLVFWNESGTLVSICTDDAYFILRYDSESVERIRASGVPTDDDGIEEAFELLMEREDSVRTAHFVGDCFIYTNAVNRLNYYVGGEIVTIAHLDRQMSILGYQPKENRLYLGDKELSVVSYELLVSVLEYQTAVMRKDFTAADKILPTIPKDQRTRIAHFLEKQGFTQQALAVTTDSEHKFELALQLGDLRTAIELAKDADNEHKWKQLAELATAQCEFGLAQKCLREAKDFGSELLLSTSDGNASLTNNVGEQALAAGQNNVAFTAFFMLGRLDRCLDVLISTGRLPEAALFARTYVPSRVNEAVNLWREKLRETSGDRAAQSLADPERYGNLFGDFDLHLRTEQYLKLSRGRHVPAAHYPNAQMNWTAKPVESMKEAEADGTFTFQPDVRLDDPDVDHPPSSSSIVVDGSQTHLKPAKPLDEASIEKEISREIDDLQLDDHPPAGPHGTGNVGINDNDDDDDNDDGDDDDDVDFDDDDDDDDD